MHGSPNGSAALATDLLNSFPLFERLPAEIAERVTRDHGYRSLQPGAVVINQGDKATDFNCVLSGLVKLSVTGGRHKEHIVDFVGPGQAFCMASVFLELPCPVTARVLEAGRLLVLNRQAVMEAVAQYPPLALRLLGRLSFQLYQQIRAAETDAVSSSAERVIRWLVSHLEPPANSRTIAFPVNKKTTAASLNVTPETLSRVLRALREMGLIEVGRKDITVLDADRLRAVRLQIFGNALRVEMAPTGQAPEHTAEIDVAHWFHGPTEDSDSEVPHWGPAGSAATS
jgi:CRP-like cAMP-binding protein